MFNPGRVICLGILMCVPLFGLLVIHKLIEIQFNQNCAGYLKIAGDANNVELASSRLDRAIEYIERKGYTKGNTGVFFSKPTNDVGLWYQNLKAAQINLHELPEDAGALEISNALIKLRETLIDHSDQGDVVTTPDGIEVFPYNVLVFFMYVLTGVGIFLGLLLIVFGLEAAQ